MAILSKYNFWAFVLIFLLLVGCENKDAAADYRAEADALCEVFNPDKWKDILKDMTPVEIQTKLADGIQAALKSDKMKEILQTAPKIPAEVRYKYVIESIGELTGQSFSCEGMKLYFS